MKIPEYFLERLADKAVPVLTLEEAEEVAKSTEMDFFPELCRPEVQVLLLQDGTLLIAETELRRMLHEYVDYFIAER